MAQEQLRNNAQQQEPPKRPEPTHVVGERVTGLQLLSGNMVFPHGSSSLMVGEHLSALGYSGIVREIVLTADGNARIGLTLSDKPEGTFTWFAYCGPFFARAMPEKRQ